MDSKNIKFFDGCSRQMDPTIHQKKDIVKDESFLLLPKIHSKKKTTMELKDKMHPNDFDISIKSENIQNRKQINSYYGNNFGPGRGFGNVDLNNQFRDGESTRLSNETFHKNQESYINERSDILTKNYQNPDNIILPFPRGGEITRKSENFLNQTSDKTNFEFKY